MLILLLPSSSFYLSSMSPIFSSLCEDVTTIINHTIVVVAVVAAVLIGNAIFMFNDMIV